MIAWAKRFFTDETAFIGYMRAGLLGLGGLGLYYPDNVPKWLSVGAMMGAGMIRAGEKNVKGDA